MVVEAKARRAEPERPRRARRAVGSVFGRCAGEVAVFEAVAIALEGEDLGVVDEAVDHGCGDGVVAEISPQAEKGLLDVTIRLARS